MAREGREIVKPYDWCNASCPNPCSCQETIEANMRDEEDRKKKAAEDENYEFRKWWLGNQGQA